MEKTLLVDHTRCTGCRLCEMVCAVQHTGANNPTRSRIHIVKWPLQGFELPMVCQQCEDAPCLAVCPTHALTRDPTLGRVSIDYDLCIGCKLCVIACPLGGMGIDTVNHQVIKCDLCDGDPVCVRFCGPEALRYVPASSLNLAKKRAAALKLSEVMKRSFSRSP